MPVEKDSGGSSEQEANGQVSGVVGSAKPDKLSFGGIERE